MLKLLIHKQLSEIFRAYLYDAKKNKTRSKGATAAYIVLFVLITACSHPCRCRYASLFRRRAWIGFTLL